MAELKCRKIDRYALRLFMGMTIYFFIVHSHITLTVNC